jgi:hypothetical protein
VTEGGWRQKYCKSAEERNGCLKSGVDHHWDPLAVQLDLAGDRRGVLSFDADSDGELTAVFWIQSDPQRVATVVVAEEPTVELGIFDELG